MNANEVLDREYLQIRAKILEIAASLDRVDRGVGSVDADPRVELIAKGISLLSDEKQGRAERVQLLFSREYDPDWKSEFQKIVTSG